MKDRLILVIFLQDRKPVFLKTKNDLHSALNTGIGFLKSPLNFTSEDLILTGIIVGATSASLLIDQPVRVSVKKIHSPELDQITPFGEGFGNAKYSTALSGVSYIGGFLIDDPELRKTGLILMETLFFNGLITQGLKMIMGRARPYLNDGNMDIDFFTFEMDQEDYSMPSGHTSAAFSVATVLSERIENIFASAALYSLAGLTAFQRIYRDQHWFSDTILAAVLGTVIGLKIVKLNSEESEVTPKGASVNFVPVFSLNSVGIGISAAF
ncbi:MAG: phosphatase PAP2 family protein [Ignavibacteria bacterium]